MDIFSIGYLGLFFGSFLSATLVPFPSEGLLIGFLNLDYSIWLSVSIAAVGNTLGGITNYYLGRFGSSQKVFKRFKINEKKLEKWNARSIKYGHWLGFLAWIPIIGDPMLVALGFFKSKFWPLLVTVFIGKLSRYLILTWIYLRF